jgi:hypothetical protein
MMPYAAPTAFAVRLLRLRMSTSIDLERSYELVDVARLAEQRE